MNKCDEDVPRSCLPQTRSAISAIRNSGLREDMLFFLEGAEYCYRVGEIQLALENVRFLCGTAVVIHRTLGPDVAIAIIDGIIEDSGSTATALRMGFGFNKNHDEKCDIKPGTPTGSSSCVEQKNSVCYTLGVSGCGGTSGFQFVWEARYRLALA